jgi:hypothetical protein
LLQGNAKVPAYLYPITVSFNSRNNTYTLTPPSGLGTYYWVKNENSLSDPSTQIKTGSGQLIVSKDESPDRVVYTCFISNPAATYYLMCQPFVVPNQADRIGVLDVQSINSFNSGGGVKTFDVTSSNVTWNASASGSWLSLSTTVGGPGVTSINLTSASNSGSLRNAIVTVNGTTTNGQSITKTINVSQSGNSSDISLTTLTPTSAYAGAGTINYNGLNIAGNTMKVSGQTYT